jgi:hypothetical protein
MIELELYYMSEPFGDAIDAQRMALIPFKIEQVNAKHKHRVKLKNFVIGGGK